MRLNRMQLIVAAGMSVATCAAQAQSLMRAPTTPVSTSPTGQTDENAELKVASYFFIEPPKAKTFQKHDQITILVEETSSQSSKQALDTKKDYTLTDALTEFPDLAKLLELQAVPGVRSPLSNLSVSSQNKFNASDEKGRNTCLLLFIKALFIQNQKRRIRNFGVEWKHILLSMGGL